MECVFRCRECEHSEAWTTFGAAMSASVWHVYEAHYQLWCSVIGERLPWDPRPEEFGRRFEAWERQS